MRQRKGRSGRESATCIGLLRSLLRSVFPGKCLRLWEGVLKQLREREWVFNRVENGVVFLSHESRAYGIAVKIEDIDWNVQ